MKIFSNLNARIKAYREEHMGENGFSLLELVVAVGVLLALSVGGFLAYSGITANAKKAATESAASQVLAGAVAYTADGDVDTTPETAADEYNTGQTDIVTTATEGANGVITVTATNKDSKVDVVTKTATSVDEVATP